MVDLVPRTRYTGNLRKCIGTTQELVHPSLGIHLTSPFPTIQATCASSSAVQIVAFNRLVPSPFTSISTLVNVSGTVVFYSSQHNPFGCSLQPGFVVGDVVLLTRQSSHFAIRAVVEVIGLWEVREEKFGMRRMESNRVDLEAVQLR